MSLTISVVTGGTNSHQTTSEEVNFLQTDFFNAGVVNLGTATTGDFAVTAQAPPDMTVAVSAGVCYVTATPSGGNSQLLRVKNSASTNVTISTNTTGGTRYDWLYLKVDSTAAANPASDASDVATLVTSRSTSNTTDNGTPPTYGTLLAVITVANGASSISSGNISDSRVAAGGGRLVNVRTYTASSTWTKPPGIRSAVVECIGGGAAGGGTGTTNSSQISVGSGGGSGVYARSKIATASLSATHAITIGAGGTGVSGTTGNNGGTSSFGVLVSADGGNGGTTVTSTGTAGNLQPAAAPTGTGTGDVVIPSRHGGVGMSFFGGVNNNIATGGMGGNSQYGSGGRGTVANTSGIAGTGYGGGGSGSARSSSQAATAGGAGTAGIVIVYEYF